VSRTATEAPRARTTVEWAFRPGDHVVAATAVPGESAASGIVIACIAEASAADVELIQVHRLYRVTWFGEDGTPFEDQVMAEISLRLAEGDQ